MTMRTLIVGAGIGGLTAALSLHAAGRTDIGIVEAARDLREIGVGVNLPPHAVRELVELGLGEALASIGHPTATLSYYDRSGQLIWAEPRGLDAGYRWPQYSVHRGRLQQLLLHTVQQRLGEAAVQTGQRATGVTQDAEGMELRTLHARTGALQRHRADLVVGADGIRSAVRAALFAQAVPLATNGWVMYRGATAFAPFLDGRTMVIVGDEQQRIVVYPIDATSLNWLLVRPMASGEQAADDLGNWNRQVDPQAIAAHVADWRFDWLDVPALVATTATAYEYPMADIDPLPHWTFGRATLLGDAAHAMYPFGSNGASQAILDARVLAHALAHHATLEQGLAAYEHARREAVAKVQLANRRQASDVMARVGALARAQAHGTAMAELQAVEQQYKNLAGFDVETLNKRPSWDVVPPQS